MTTTDRHEAAEQRGLDAPSTATAGVTGTSVPRHCDQIHDHYDQAHALGYLRGYADGREDGRLVGLDAAREAVERVSSLLQPLGPALAAIDALRGQPTDQTGYGVQDAP